MKTSPKRKDIPSQRRADILAAAAELFSHRGYYGVTVDAIAQGAGISKGNLYWYFRSKEEIFQALFDDLSERLRLSLPSQEIMESDASPREKVCAAARSLLETAEANPEAMSLMLQIAGQGELNEVVSSGFTLAIRQYIDFLTPLFAEMGETNPEGIATIYAINIGGLMGMVAIAPEAYDREKLLALLEERHLGATSVGTGAATLFVD